MKCTSALRNMMSNGLFDWLINWLIRAEDGSFPRLAETRIESILLL